MQLQDIPLSPPLHNGTYVADGWGIKIHVYRRHLVIEDGTGPERRAIRFHKASANLKRLVVLGSTGYISLDAVRWLADAGVAFAQIDSDQRVLMTSQPMGSDRAALRRAQGWALTNETGIDVVRYLLDRKLEGQGHIADQLGGGRQPIDEARRQLEHAATLDELLWLEASAANHYWNTWTGVECRFIRRDQQLVPDHWRQFDTRGSRFNASGPRGAANPINALLNYLYALLEAEAVFACQTVGLDPGIGILHADERSRDSFALDLMEPARPLVDQQVLRLLKAHRFKTSDFAETRKGICRLQPSITRWLGDSMPDLAEGLASQAELVAKTLAATPGVRLDRIPSPLTGSNRSIGRPRRGKRERGPSHAPSHCHRCGVETVRGRTHCDRCLPEAQAEHLIEMVQTAHRELKRRRAAGDDPAHGGQAAVKRGESISRNTGESYRCIKTWATIEHLNHLPPWDKPSTVSICCWSCNSSRGNRLLRDWFESEYCRSRGIDETTVAKPVRDFIREFEGRV